MEDVHWNAYDITFRRSHVYYDYIDYKTMSMIGTGREILPSASQRNANPEQIHPKI
jgi:hypothetical protein